MNKGKDDVEHGVDGHDHSADAVKTDSPTAIDNRLARRPMIMVVQRAER